MNDMDRDGQTRSAEPAVPESDPWFGGPQPPSSTEHFGNPVMADAALTPDGDIRDDPAAEAGEIEPEADETPEARPEAREEAS